MPPQKEELKKILEEEERLANIERERLEKQRKEVGSRLGFRFFRIFSSIINELVVVFVHTIVQVEYSVITRYPCERQL